MREGGAHQERVDAAETSATNGAVTAKASAGPRAAALPHSRCTTRAKEPHSTPADAASTSTWPKRAANG